MSDLVQDTTFSGEDWALEEVDRVRYEDCAFHDVDWSEARLTGCVFSHCTFGNVRFNASTLDGVALREVDLRGARIDLAQAALFASAHGAVVSG